MARKILKVVGGTILGIALVFGLYKALLTPRQIVQVDYIGIMRGGVEVKVDIEDYEDYELYFCDNIYDKCNEIKDIQNKIQNDIGLNDDEKTLISTYETLLDNYVYEEESK